MKYIHFEHLGIVIFEDHVRHDTLRQLVGHKALSAGQFVCDADEARCCGDSVSLGVRNDPTDTTRIRRLLRGY